jgi:hypothetical protein
MLAFTRERMMDSLSQVSKLIDMYQRRESQFIEKTVAWLTAAEESLLQIKSPLASFVAAERGKLLAASDGYINHEINPGRHSNRKTQAAMAALVLSRVELAVRNQIVHIDEKFDALREKMIQFVAVSTANGSPSYTLPAPFEPREAWLKTVWESLKVSAETANMRNYLNTALTPSDRLYLLDSFIDNLGNPQ